MFFLEAGEESVSLPIPASVLLGLHFPSPIFKASKAGPNPSHTAVSLALSLFYLLLPFLRALSVPWFHLESLRCF